MFHLYSTQKTHANKRARARTRSPLNEHNTRLFPFAIIVKMWNCENARAIVVFTHDCIAHQLLVVMQLIYVSYP